LQYICPSYHSITKTALFFCLSLPFSRKNWEPQNGKDEGGFLRAVPTFGTAAGLLYEFRSKKVRITCLITAPYASLGVRVQEFLIK
jgi:hypothetical protein